MSGIMINVKAGATYEQSSVTVTGEMVHLINDVERNSFGIRTDSDLKRAIGKYFGKEPTDVYLGSPTPWNDLYKSYGWSQVQTVLKPIRAQILGVDTKPVILNTNTLVNDSEVTAVFASKIHAAVTDSVASTWSNNSKVKFEQKLTYKVGFLGTEGGGETSFGFEQDFGKSETVTKETTVGMETGVSVELKPKQSAIIELSANAGSMKVRVFYRAYLTGQTAVNYYPRYKGHHFYGIYIGNVVESNEIQVVQDIEIGFYCNTKAKVRSAETNERLAFVYSDVGDAVPIEGQSENQE